MKIMPSEDIMTMISENVIQMTLKGVEVAAHEVLLVFSHPHTGEERGLVFKAHPLARLKDSAIVVEAFAEISIIEKGKEDASGTGD
ncbi:hypothetical protein CMI37_33400 [Candidatus Pacearchaeota archaeon]|nr:hypothetical protein [Candidatus Pacearchaeota archaeon]|tara:strand:- start:539 stop:796 length:258 start_codon:yes stop_codon:yes gene_type:complete